LLADGFAPRRTIYLAFGHDEEVGGAHGATTLAARLAERGVVPLLVLDEGGAVTEGIVSDVASPVALVGIAEKGYVSVELVVQAEGGHSSQPRSRGPKSGRCRPGSPARCAVSSRRPVRRWRSGTASRSPTSGSSRRS